MLFQGLAEVGAGLGYAIGPVIGGFLYKVHNILLYYMKHNHTSHTVKQHQYAHEKII